MQEKEYEQEGFSQEAHEGSQEASKEGHDHEERHEVSKYRSRKYILTWFILLTSSLFLPASYIDQSTWSTVVLGISGLYFGANVAKTNWRK